MCIYLCITCSWMYVCIYLCACIEHIYIHEHVLAHEHNSSGSRPWTCSLLFFSCFFVKIFRFLHLPHSFFVTLRCFICLQLYASGIMISVESYWIHPVNTVHCFLQGIENVYTQHQPLLFQTIESIVKGRLRDIDYPFIGNHFQHGRFDLNILNFYHINSFTSNTPSLRALIASYAFACWQASGCCYLHCRRLNLWRSSDRSYAKCCQ